MTSYLSRTARCVLLIALFVTFGIKALTPVGYMPTAIGNGWPFTLCDAGFHIDEQIQPPAHAGHDGHGDSARNLHWKDCPLGALASALAVPVEHALSPGGIDTGTPGFLEIRFSFTTRVANIRVRGPPQLTLVV